MAVFETSDVLIRVGEFRIVKHPDGPEASVVQHFCHRDLTEYIGGRFSDSEGGWQYCLLEARRCARCSEPVPEGVQGLHLMHNWERYYGGV